MRRYVLGNVQSEDVFVNWFGVLGVLYFIGIALLLIIHILYTQKWARGHRCSLRHNVCRRATDAIAKPYN